jgi:hypothetical protein
MPGGVGSRPWDRNPIARLSFVVENEDRASPKADLIDRPGTHERGHWEYIEARPRRGHQRTVTPHRRRPGRLDAFIRSIAGAVWRSRGPIRYGGHSGLSQGQRTRQYAGYDFGLDVSPSDVIPDLDAPTSGHENPLVFKGFDASSRLVSSSVVSTGEATRTPDLRIMRPQDATSWPPENKENSSDKPTLAPYLLHDDCPTDPIATDSTYHTPPAPASNADPRLTMLIDAWDRLPEAIRAGIVAMIGVASKE